jgi:hypothetical protein
MAWLQSAWFGTAAKNTQKYKVTSVAPSEKQTEKSRLFLYGFSSAARLSKKRSSKLIKAYARTV